MAKFTVEKWRCDRCHKVDDRWLKPSSAYEVCVSVDYGTAGGPIMSWREMCVTCNDDVAKQIKAMEQSAIAARQALKETPDAQ